MSAAAATRAVRVVSATGLDLIDDALNEYGEGRMYWCIARDDLAQGRFDRARGEFQQT
ncbi:MAG: hypothetical protein WKF96_19340 [Solirubrobacteraceae bacterium]